MTQPAASNHSAGANANGTSSERKMISLEETVALLRESDNILVASHLRPDGDCVGSSVALVLGLQQLGKRVAAFNRDEINVKMNYLEGAEMFSQSFPDWPVDITVFVDCGAVHRVADDFVPPGKRTLNIDHHLSNDRYADFNYIDIEAAAVGEQICNILKKLGAKITPAIAAGAYLSLMSDTGGFRYSNTTASSFDLAAELVRAGASPGLTSTMYYESRDPGELILTGRAFSRIKMELDGKLAWAELRAEDYDIVGGEDVEPDGLVNELRQMRGVEVSLLIHERKDGGLRAGLRGKGLVDCAAIASSFGGGGHFNASGLNMPNRPYAEARDFVLRDTMRQIEEQLKAAPAERK